MNSLTPEYIVLIDAEQCVGCGICVDVCVDAALIINSGDFLPVWRPARCTKCDKCALECPTDAIAVHGKHEAAQAA